MPYIENKDKAKFYMVLDELRSANLNTVGELNYLITSMCLEYLEKKGEKYQHYNDVIGALECAKLEMYRRKVSNYEDGKIQSNGDVYPKS